MSFVTFLAQKKKNGLRHLAPENIIYLNGFIYINFISGTITDLILLENIIIFIIFINLIIQIVDLLRILFSIFT